MKRLEQLGRARRPPPPGLACASDDALWRIGAVSQGLSGAYAHMGEGLLRLLAVRLRTAA